jgi:hypothetical protein
MILDKGIVADRIIDGEMLDERNALWFRTRLANGRVACTYSGH